MKQFDRALYAIVLLVLLADVARSYASAPLPSEAAGTLLLSAATQLQSGSAAGAMLVLRGAERSCFGGPANSLKAARSSAPADRTVSGTAKLWALSGWPRMLRISASPQYAALAPAASGWASLSQAAVATSAPAPSEPYLRSFAVFEHFTSPAP